MIQAFIARPSHLDRRSTITVIAPMTLVPVETFPRAATVAHENVGLLFLVSRRKSHFVDLKPLMITRKTVR
jgi:hypothetical protein